MSREIDAKVAELVMGWKRNPGGWWDIPDTDPDHEDWDGHDDCELPYTTAVDADYSVLVKVRETWDYDKRLKFGRALQEVWDKRERARSRGDDEPIGVRDILLYQHYQPGDYSRATLAALGERKE